MKTERMMCPMCERSVQVVGPPDARRLGVHRNRRGPCSGSGTTAARAAEWRESFERRMHNADRADSQEEDDKANAMRVRESK